MVYQVVVKGPGLEGQPDQTGLTFTFADWGEDPTLGFLYWGEKSSEIGSASGHVLDFIGTVTACASVSPNATVLELSVSVSCSATVLEVFDKASVDAVVNAPSKETTSASASFSAGWIKVHAGANRSANDSASEFASEVFSAKVRDTGS